MTVLPRPIDHVRAAAGQGRQDRQDRGADERLAAAALLVLVARVDGVLNAAAG